MQKFPISSHGSDALSRVLVEELGCGGCLCLQPTACRREERDTEGTYSALPALVPSLPSVRTWTIPQPMSLAHLNSELEPSAIFLEVTHCVARRRARLRSRMSCHLAQTRTSGSSARGGTKNRIFSAISVGRKEKGEVWGGEM